jgi:hypothetical protein
MKNVNVLSTTVLAIVLLSYQPNSTAGNFFHEIWNHTIGNQGLGGLLQGGDKAHEVWNHSIGKDGIGGGIGDAWDHSFGSKGLGPYIEKHPLEAALLAASMAYGGYLIASGSPVTLSMLIPTTEGTVVAIPIATVSSTTAGTVVLSGGAAGVLNALNDAKNQDTKSISKADLEKLNQFRTEIESKKELTPEQTVEIYARYFDAKKYGRSPGTSVFVIDLVPSAPWSMSNPNKMHSIEIAAPVHENGGDVLSTGDFMNIRNAGNDQKSNQNVSRLHAAYDISAKVGTKVYAPMSGVIVPHINYPYGEYSMPKAGTMLGLTIKSDVGLSSQIFYVKPSPDIMDRLKKGKEIPVKAGDTVIGTAQDVHGYYVEKGSNSPPENHVHLQFIDENGNSLSLDGKQEVKKDGVKL